MLSGILYRPLANAMNFRFVALEIRERLLWKRLECPYRVSYMSPRPPP